MVKFYSEPVRLPQDFTEMKLATLTVEFPDWIEGRVRSSSMPVLLNDGPMPDQSSEAVRKELERFQGKWWTSRYRGREYFQVPAKGKPVSRYLFEQSRVRDWMEGYDKNNILVIQEYETAEIEIDPDSPVKRITWKSRVGEHESLYIGIYEFKDDTLRFQLNQVYDSNNWPNRAVEFDQKLDYLLIRDRQDAKP